MEYIMKLEISFANYKNRQWRTPNLLRSWTQCAPLYCEHTANNDFSSGFLPSQFCTVKVKRTSTPIADFFIAVRMLLYCKVAPIYECTDLCKAGITFNVEVKSQWYHARHSTSARTNHSEIFNHQSCKSSQSVACGLSKICFHMMPVLHL